MVNIYLEALGYSLVALVSGLCGWLLRGTFIAARAEKITVSSDRLPESDYTAEDVCAPVKRVRKKAVRKAPAAKKPARKAARK